MQRHPERSKEETPCIDIIIKSGFQNPQQSTMHTRQHLEQWEYGMKSHTPGYLLQIIDFVEIFCRFDMHNHVQTARCNSFHSL